LEPLQEVLLVRVVLLLLNSVELTKQRVEVHLERNERKATDSI
jgi:hypothetical protein